VATWLYGKW